MKFLAYTVVGATAFAVVWFTWSDELTRFFFKPTESSVAQYQYPEEIQQPEVLVEQLNIPWEIAFLPNGDWLVTERRGTIERITAESRTEVEINGVVHNGEGGLLGMVLHPDFAKNRWVYIYLTSRGDGSGLTGRVERYVFDNGEFTERTTILEGIPGAAYHDGGRIAFGPDGYLYVAVGDAANEDNAQNTDILAGKILRIEDDGSVPSDNPFGNEVYSYGHRNPQGLAWDDSGQLWATEHGPSGAQTGFDELNKIEKGKNYGWPDAKGYEVAEDSVPAVLSSGADDTWAPSGLAFVDGKFVFAGLRGESLYVADLVDGEVVNLRAYFRTEYGRLRTVTLGPDGMLYLLTSNRDGRGNARGSDDRIIRVDPRALES